MTSLKTLAQTLEISGSHLARLPVVTGFDGFVDEVITVVRERRGPAEFVPVGSISEFAGLISAAAGKSSLREVVIRRSDRGGCAINLMDGLASLGLPVTTFATLGEPAPHPVFPDERENVTLHSWGTDPGRTLAYEFADGKLMHSAVAQLADFTPADVTRRLKDGLFEEACRDARLIALTDWTLFPHMTGCWELLQEVVFRKVASGTPFFLDLVDPSSRSEADLRDMLSVLPGFEACGPTTLGLNVNEATVLSRLLEIAVPDESGPAETLAQAGLLREALGLSEIVIHRQRFSVASSRSEQASAESFYCGRPVKTTGAGDRFNAGYVVGTLLELPAESRLRIAHAVSGFYVRTGKSPNLEDLVTFLGETPTP